MICQIFAQPTIPENPHSPWVRKQVHSLGKLKDIETVDQLFRVVSVSPLLMQSHLNETCSDS